MARRWGREREVFPAAAAGGRAPFCTPPGAWAGSEGGFAMGRASKGRVADWFVGGLAQVLDGVGERVSWGVGAGARGLVTFVAWMGCMARVGYTVHVHAVLDALSLLGVLLDSPGLGSCRVSLVCEAIWLGEGRSERAWVELEVESGSGGGESNQSLSINRNECALYRW